MFVRGVPSDICILFENIGTILENTNTPPPPPSLVGDYEATGFGGYCLNPGYIVNNWYETEDIYIETETYATSIIV